MMKLLPFEAGGDQAKNVLKGMLLRKTGVLCSMSMAEVHLGLWPQECLSPFQVNSLVPPYSVGTQPILTIMVYLLTPDLHKICSCILLPVSGISPAKTKAKRAKTRTGRRTQREQPYSRWPFPHGLLHPMFVGTVRLLSNFYAVSHLFSWDLREHLLLTSD